MLQFFKGHKKILIPYLAVLILVPLAFFYLASHKNQPVKNIQPDKKPQTIQDQPQVTETHSKLYWVDLEYDPKTKVVTELKTQQVNGDLPPLLDMIPPQTPSRFTYKVVVVSAQGETIQTGWYSTPKKLITTPKNTFHFSITTPNLSSAFIKLSLPSDKLIWTGVIK